MTARAQLEATRQARNGAKSAFDGRVAALRSDLKNKGIAQRVTDDVVGKGADLIDQGIELASENKPVIAGTLGALALWFLRRPLIDLVMKVRGSNGNQAKDANND